MWFRQIGELTICKFASEFVRCWESSNLTVYPPFIEPIEWPLPWSIFIRNVCHCHHYQAATLGGDSDKRAGNTRWHLMISSFLELTTTVTSHYCRIFLIALLDNLYTVHISHFSYRSKCLFRCYEKTTVFEELPVTHHTAIIHKIN